MKIILRISSMLCFLVILIILGCQKEFLTKPDSKISNTSVESAGREDEIVEESCDYDFAFKTNEISVVDGRYCFPNYDVLLKTVRSLECCISNTELNDNALKDLENTGKIGDYIPEVPSLEIFNNLYPEVKSLRQKYDKIEHQIDNGEKEENAIDEILFWDPALGSIINEKNQVQVGNFIYKYLNNNQTLIYSIEKSVMEKVDKCENLLKLENSLNLFRVDDRKELDIEFYEKFEELNRSGGCDLSIVHKNNGSLFDFEVKGVFPGSPQGLKFNWQIIDGNGVIISNSPTYYTHFFSYTVPTNVVYPLTVKVLLNDGECTATKVFAQGPPGYLDNYDCGSLNFSFSLIDPTTIELTIPPNTPSLTWTFNNIDNFSSDPVGSSGGSFIYNLPDNYTVPFRICASVLFNDCSNFICYTISDVGCGDITSFRRKEKGDYVPEIRRVKFKFQLRDPLLDVSKIVAKNKHNGIPADKLSIFINGSDPSTGDLIYYDDTDCIKRTEFASITGVETSGIVGSRKLVKHAHMRKGDDKADFRVEETLFPFQVPAGMTNPIVFTRTL